MFSFFNKNINKGKGKGFSDKLRFLGVDMHNHILPGIDDGCKNTDESLILLRGLEKIGFEKFICTPHIMEGIYPNNRNTIYAARDLLNDHLQQSQFLLSVGASAEYMIDEGFMEILNQGQICVMPGGYVLVEMSYLSESNELFQIIFDIQKRGYKPILAHPERYSFYHGRKEIFKRIKDAGCMLQLNLLSVSSYYGKDVKSAARQLMKEGMYDFVGTDMHHLKHLRALEKVVEFYPVEEMLKSCPLKNLSLLDFVK